MKLGLHLNVPPSGQSYGLKPDRPLPPRFRWLQIKVRGEWQTHAMATGMNTTLCGMALPLRARTGRESEGCEACKAAAKKVPMLTPQMEAEWWAKNS